MKKAIFIDKDGVIVDTKGYPYVIPTDKLLEESLDSLKQISNSDISIIVSKTAGRPPLNRAVACSLR